MTSKSVISFVIFALVLFGGYTTVNNAISLGRQQNYQPDQPIKFSHETHAGLNKIDCNYCHDGARRSKQSLIPATNTCMNCHAAIKKAVNLVQLKFQRSMHQLVIIPIPINILINMRN